MTDAASNPEDQWESGNPDQSNVDPDTAAGQSDAIPPGSNPDDLEHADEIGNEAANENLSQTEIQSQSEMKEDTDNPVDNQSEGYISEPGDQNPDVVVNEEDMTQNDNANDKVAEDNISLDGDVAGNANELEQEGNEKEEENREEIEDDPPGLQAEVTF